MAGQLDRASVAYIGDSVVVETGLGETKVIALAGGSRLIMRENSRITYKRVPGEYVHVASAAFDGELAIELTRADGYLQVKTSSGGTLFTAGTYALRCEPGCPAMLVTVGVGYVLLRGETKALGSVTLHDGEHGQVPKHGSPEKVTGGSRWPALAPAAPHR